MLGEAAFVLFLSLLAALAWYPCCCGGGGTAECNDCTSDDDNPSVTFSGFSNGTYCTNCTGYNTTFVLARDGLNQCYWTKTGYVVTCLTISIQYSIGLAVVNIGATSKGYQIGLDHTYFFGGLGKVETTTHQWDNGSRDDFDCTETHAATYQYGTEIAGCQGWTTCSCTVN